ncbi:hypothetical protein EAF04_001715 [Stromatinia cepivora]|nr:hypothetical protein EAF04_001715 [Stromatinia cepivora]
MLCKVCKSIDFGDLFCDPFAAGPETRHYANYKSLAGSARKGCGLCNAVKKDYNGDLTVRCGPGYCSGPKRTIKDDFTRGVAEFWFEWKIYDKEGIKQFRSVIHNFCEDAYAASQLQKSKLTHAYIESPAAALNIIGGRPFFVTLCFSQSCETARTWLQDCLESHQGFCPGKRAALPSCVIDVGSDNNFGTPHIHISKDGEMGSWVVLSHCWGQIHSHVTNVTSPSCRMRSSLGVWDSNICGLIRSAFYKVPTPSPKQINCLSRNACEMIIKILCIMYYRRRRVFRSGRLPEHFARIRDKCFCFPVAKSLGPAESCTTHPEADTNPRSESPGRRRTALATRGWTLQEHVLSPRVLHYISKQLLQKLSGPNVNPEILWSSDRLRFKMDPKRFFLAPNYGQNYISENFGPSYAQPLDLRKRWYSLVNEYAARSLTFETDRLFALAALTQEIETHFGLTSWMGIWAEDIHDGLLWSTSGARSIPEAYVAPSWSWASLGLENQNLGRDVGYYSNSEEGRINSSRFRAQITGCEIITADGISNGRILSAKLTLRTLCVNLDHWPVSGDVTIARPNMIFPEARSPGQLLLKFDRLSEDGSLKLRSLRVKAFPPERKGFLRSVSSFIYTHPAKSKNRPVPNFNKAAQARIQETSGALPEQASSDTYVSRPDPTFFRVEQPLQKLSTLQRTSSGLTMVQIGSIPGLFDIDKQCFSVICLVVEPGTEEGTFRRVGLAQVPNSQKFSSVPWEMRTIVLV